MDNFQINNIDSTPYVEQTYNEKDINLLSPVNINKEFGESNDIIEMHILSPSGDILFSNYNFTDYRKVNNVNNSSLFDTIALDPIKDVKLHGYSIGQFDIIYNFNRLLFNSSNNSRFFIKEISRDRTELKITSNDLTFIDLQSLFIEYIINKNQKNFYSDFSLNFGDNKSLIGVNIELDTNVNIPSLFIKLYEPLPLDNSIKDTLWIEENISEPYVFRLNNSVIIEDVVNLFPLRGPNFDIEINKQINTPTSYLNISNVLDNNITSSYNQLQSLIGENININIDYNDLTNFVHFSSAKERVENFVYKLTQIQNLERDLNILTNLSSSVDTGSINNSILTINNQISTITKNFDGYEYFLYYESGSNSFPKSTSQKPYINESVTSSISLEWIGSDNEQNSFYGGKILDHVNYDIQNRDYVWNNLPEYIKYDSQNSQLELMVSMMGQHYDYVWTYIKDITNKSVNDNRLNYGISKDLVAETLKSFGIKLYTNSRNNENIYMSLLGENPDGTFLPSTGSYHIDNYVTASMYTIPDDSINKETYKRLYNNLPFLLKARGTQKGTRALINCFGIPDTILNIKEFGGVIKEQDFIEQKTNKFNYALNLNVHGVLENPFLPSNQQYINTGFNDIYPDTIEFRFKLNEVFPVQPVFESGNDSKKVYITHVSGALATINFIIGDTIGGEIESPFITLPLYNNEWWNVVWSRENGGIRASETGSNNTYTLTIGNRDERGIQYLESCSISIDGATQSAFNKCWNENDFIYPGSYNEQQSYAMQEFRYWIGSIPLDDIKDHILNPKSFSYKNETGSYDNLIYRLPLGSELDNNTEQYLYSVHPSQIPSFIDGVLLSSRAELYNYTETAYEPNYEKYLINVPNGGSFIESNEKIKIIETKTLPDNVLSPNVTIVKKLTYEQVKNSSNIEIGISQQNSINDDIIKQLGNFNIDDYIGDPKDGDKESFPSLDKLRNFYFQKYNKNESIKDSVKLLSYFDNSLFKMVKDFIPAKANLSTGLIIKPTILEKNKTKKFEPKIERKDKETSISTAEITGSNGLDTDLFIANDETYPSALGYVTKDGVNNKEWLNGEISGSHIIAYSQSLENIVYENNKIGSQESGSIEKIELNPILNNVENVKKNSKRFKVEYNNSINIPDNINYISQSLFSINSKPNELIYSDVQESNYSLKRYVDPRYKGSKTNSKVYNKYSIGDKSYGKTAAIDKENIKFSYFQEITSQSRTLPERTNVYIKYLIDENSNITELTRQNKNLFDVQNIFNKGNVNIVLDDNKFPSQQQKLDGLKSIFAGGFRYEPILQNIRGTHKFLEYTYENDFPIPNDGSVGEVIEELDENSLTIGIPFLENPLSSPPLNVSTNLSLTVGLDSRILLPVSRSTGETREIRQRITGSVEFVAYVSPPTDIITRLYTGLNFTGTEYKIYGSIQTPWVTTYFDNFTSLQGANDNILSVQVPAGIILDLYGGGNYGGSHFTYVGPAAASAAAPYGQCPLCRSGDGVTGVKTTVVDCLASSNITNTLNTFNKSMRNELLMLNSSNEYVVSEMGNSLPIFEVSKLDEIGIRIIYDIEGYVILPAGQNSANLVLQNLSYSDAKIRGNIIYKNESILNRIQMTAPPKTYFSLNKLNSPFLLGSPPEIIYITGSIDNGFISGSENNYFFERGTYNGSNVYSLLTASYDLSRVYYEQKEQGNNFQQTFPPFFQKGYEDIEDNFELKTGDLLRFYNHDKDEFPVNFEREVVKVIPPTNQPSKTFIDETNRLFILVDDNILNQSCIDNGIGIPFKIQNFIFLSKIPDETNIIINSTKKSGKTSPGLIIPEDVNKSLKEKSGNIIKQLKNQNLI